MPALKLREYPAVQLVVAVSVWITLTGNYSFFSHLYDAYPFSWKYSGFVISLTLLLVALSSILMTILAVGRVFKPVLATALIIASASAYFMDTYNVIISREVIQSALQTDTSESLGLLNSRLFLYLIFLGVLPALFVWMLPIRRQELYQSLISKAKLIAFSALTIILMLLMFSSSYASFFREHKAIRFYTNPETPLYTAISYAVDKIDDGRGIPYREIGGDARQVARNGKRRLMVLVVGETARWDHFSLNGYGRRTNPMLAEQGVLSFEHVSSCGTATAISVPCMFSILDRDHYSEKVAKATDNVLDIIQRAGVTVAWLDNNSDSKGVALRVPYINYRDPEINPSCDVECRDIGMIDGIRNLVANTPSGDLLVVLHQMGSHGPEYSRRYPESFAKFTPSCSSNLLEECTREEIDNAYDNSILYTDYFLGQVIEYLRSESSTFSPALLYISDHGESLGENGIFLHGFPYALAPESQKHVPMIFWAGPEFLRARGILREPGFTQREYSQDNLFHTLLGLLEVKTSVYQAGMDIFSS
ncbi:phosphoethanolamine transferase [Microbulbifer pacificus]|uniref:phosphoethanolamine transferase n=1 Tax=Microbulbifer pacificus TaxID=407164 RepID=UPI001319D567|nr:phosphoethanolamine--lipid A transferase [Microbulbifer pacificus]